MVDQQNIENGGARILRNQMTHDSFYSAEWQLHNTILKNPIQFYFWHALYKDWQNVLMYEVIICFLILPKNISAKCSWYSDLL